MEYMRRNEPMHYLELEKFDKMNKTYEKMDLETYILNHLSYFIICNSYVMRVIFTFFVSLTLWSIRKKYLSKGRILNTRIDYTLFQLAYAYLWVLWSSHLLLLLHKCITDMGKRKIADYLYMPFTVTIVTTSYLRAVLLMHIYTKLEFREGDEYNMESKHYVRGFLIGGFITATIIFFFKEFIGINYQLIVGTDEILVVVDFMLFCFSVRSLYKNQENVINGMHISILFHYLFCIVPHVGLLIATGSTLSWETYYEGSTNVCDIVTDWHIVIVWIFFLFVKVVDYDISVSEEQVNKPFYKITQESNIFTCRCLEILKCECLSEPEEPLAPNDEAEIPLRDLEEGHNASHHSEHDRDRQLDPDAIVPDPSYRSSLNPDTITFKCGGTITYYKGSKSTIPCDNLACPDCCEPRELPKESLCSKRKSYSRSSIDQCSESGMKNKNEMSIKAEIETVRASKLSLSSIDDSQQITSCSCSISRESEVPSKTTSDSEQKTSCGKCFKTIRKNENEMALKAGIKPVKTLRRSSSSPTDENQSSTSSSVFRTSPIITRTLLQNMLEVFYNRGDIHGQSSFAGLTQSYPTGDPISVAQLNVYIRALTIKRNKTVEQRKRKNRRDSRTSRNVTTMRRKRKNRRGYRTSRKVSILRKQAAERLI